jgi:hypothetical protein
VPVDAEAHPLMALNGMMTMRLQRLHFSSKARPRTLAINCPHSHLVSGRSAMVGDAARERGILDIENNY